MTSPKYRITWTNLDGYKFSVLAIGVVNGYELYDTLLAMTKIKRSNVIKVEMTMLVKGEKFKFEE